MERRRVRTVLNSSSVRRGVFATGVTYPLSQLAIKATLGYRPSIDQYEAWLGVVPTVLSQAALIPLKQVLSGSGNAMYYRRIGAQVAVTFIKSIVENINIYRLQEYVEADREIGFLVGASELIEIGGVPALLAGAAAAYIHMRMVLMVGRQLHHFTPMNYYAVRARGATWTIVRTLTHPIKRVRLLRAIGAVPNQASMGGLLGDLVFIANDEGVGGLWHGSSHGLVAGLAHWVVSNMLSWVDNTEPR